MEGGYKWYPVSGLIVVAFLFEDFRPGERANLVNGLLDCPSTVAPGTEVTLQVPGMGEKVRIL